MNIPRYDARGVKRFGGKWNRSEGNGINMAGKLWREQTAGKDDSKFPRGDFFPLQGKSAGQQFRHGQAVVGSHIGTNNR